MMVYFSSRVKPNKTIWFMENFPFVYYFYDFFQTHSILNEYYKIVSSSLIRFIYLISSGIVSSSIFFNVVGFVCEPTFLEKLNLKKMYYLLRETILDYSVSFILYANQVILTIIGIF